MIALKPILVELESHAMGLGVFERVNSHEPANAPRTGIHSAIWLESLVRGRAMSGLAATTGVLVFNNRLYSNLQQEPRDDIDIGMLDALNALLEAYSADFTLGGLVRQVDLLGQSGTSLAAHAGYVKQSDQMLRVMTITVPLIVNDLWDQAP